MELKILFKKIWTTPPQTIFKKTCDFFHTPTNNKPIKVIKITEGQATGINLIIPKKTKSFYIDMMNGDYESYLLNSLLTKTDLKDKTIWDVGAHIGYHSLVFAKHTGKNGKIIAFEPNFKNREIFENNLKNNLILSNRITLRKEALANEIGNTIMRISKQKYVTSSSGGYLNDVTPPLDNASYKNFEDTNVCIDTVDNLILNKHLSVPDIIKIDVEGAEFKLLKGAIKTLEIHKPILVIEIHSPLLMFDVQKILLGLQYNIEIIDRNISSVTKNILATPR